MRKNRSARKKAARNKEVIRQYAERINCEVVMCEDPERVCQHCGQGAQWVHKSDQSAWCGAVVCQRVIPAGLATKPAATEEEMQRFRAMWED